MAFGAETVMRADRIAGSGPYHHSQLAGRRTPSIPEAHVGKRIAMALLGGLLGYALGAFGGGYLVSELSSNTHDGSMEAAMTGAFVLGPLAGLAGAAVGFWRTKPSRPTRGAA
jgi:hypothetical protein